VEQARSETSSSTGENVQIVKIARFAAEGGVIGTYLHGTGIGVLVKVAGPQTDDVRTFATDVAMHAAAQAPQYMTRDQVPQDAIDAEREIYIKQVEDKPEAIRGKIADGKLNKWFSDIALVEQQWIFAKDRLGKDATITEYAQSIGDDVQVVDFVRFAVK
jgi:elongation factor Ts